MHHTIFNQGAEKIKNDQLGLGTNEKSIHLNNLQALNNWTDHRRRMGTENREYSVAYD